MQPFFNKLQFSFFHYIMGTYTLNTIAQSLNLTGKIMRFYAKDGGGLEVWNETKKKAANLYPDKFIIDGKNVLHWNDGSVSVLDKKISNTNFQKLNELADTENCSVNALVSELISNYKKHKRK